MPANPSKVTLTQHGNAPAFPGLGKEVPHAHVQRTDSSNGKQTRNSGKLCTSLADQKVSILAFQSVPAEGNSSVRMVVDNPTTAKKVLDTERLSYTETEVVQARLPYRPGELAHAASELGGSNINIEYAYSGLDSSNAPVVFFGVKDAGKAAM